LSLSPEQHEILHVPIVEEILLFLDVDPTPVEEIIEGLHHEGDLPSEGIEGEAHHIGEDQDRLFEGKEDLLQVEVHHQNEEVQVETEKVGVEVRVDRRVQVEAKAQVEVLV